MERVMVAHVPGWRFCWRGVIRSARGSRVFIRRQRSPVEERAMWKKIAGFTILLVLLVAGAGVGWAVLRKPAQRPALNVHIVATPELLARGRKIFTLADCGGCHSKHDPATFALIEGGTGWGNAIPDKELGEIDIPNITPDRETGIGTWTDGEKMRAIREGVDKDGNALFPMMPYG